VIAGLVLAGGESRRMGHDKALISIYGKSAFFHAAELLKNFCETVFVSCRENQDLMSNLVEQPTWLKEVFDHHEYAEKGPLTGLLSCMAHLGMDQNETLAGITSFDGLLVLGCDYRIIKECILTDILAVGLMQQKICCYKNPNTQIIDPLVAYYPMSILQHLPAFAETQSSLRAFIEQQPHHYLIPTSEQLAALRSFDFPI
jgi:molybdopterin-guanine dinucleotide biosynthesis protein A